MDKGIFHFGGGKDFLNLKAKELQRKILIDQIVCQKIISIIKRQGTRNNTCNKEAKNKHQKTNKTKTLRSQLINEQGMQTKTLNKTIQMVTIQSDELSKNFKSKVIMK